MDKFILNIKTFASLVNPPEKHMAHKTMRVPRHRRGQVLGVEEKPPPTKCFPLGGLLNVFPVAVGFAYFRKIGRHFLFSCHFTWIWLYEWQCYIAKYP